jgi:hypothetical protein
VWMQTQSNITNIIFTWVHNTNTHKIIVGYVTNYIVKSQCDRSTLRAWF